RVALRGVGRALAPGAMLNAASDAVGGGAGPLPAGRRRCYTESGGVRRGLGDLHRRRATMIFGEENTGPQDLPGAGRPQQPQQQQIQLDTSQMETIYANFFALAGSADEIVAYLGANTPMPGARQPVIKLSQR